MQTVLNWVELFVFIIIAVVLWNFAAVMLHGSANDPEYSGVSHMGRG